MNLACGQVLEALPGPLSEALEAHAQQCGSCKAAVEADDLLARLRPPASPLQGLTLSAQVR